MAKQEKILQCTGDQIDEAVNKVLNGYVYPTETITVTENTEGKDIANGKLLNVRVPVPDEYIKKSLLRSGIKYFDLSSNKTGTSNVNSSWYSFTPDFAPKLIVFSQSEYSNGTIQRISSSVDTVVMSWWIDTNYIDNPRYWAKGGFLRKDSTPAFTVSSDGTGMRYDSATNKIYFYCSAASYGLKSGTNSSTAAGGYYTVQYWG